MDTSAREIFFDADGVCSFCREFEKRCKHVIHADHAVQSQQLDSLVKRVKRAGSGKQYDCVVGVSGGVDSSWVLVDVVRRGLRPLAVHMDNGWNSELAQNNIENLVRGLGVDLYTHVIDWEEYRGLMQGFFDADVIDIELLYDNAMLAVNYQQALRHQTRFMLSGTNSVTEGMTMPREWSWCKMDKRNIVHLGNRNGVRMRTFPSISTLGHIWNGSVRRREWVWYLDYLPYNKAAAVEELQKHYSYKPYPYKHYESIFTRFYQGYILPEKFGVDKRRLHLSSLIISGQMTRGEAVEVIKGIPYASKEALEADKLYFLKKMGWTITQLDDYIQRPSKPHDDYRSEAWFFNLCRNLRDRLAR